VCVCVCVLLLFLSPGQEHAFSLSLCLISPILVAAGRWTVLVAMLCISSTYEHTHFNNEQN